MALARLEKKVASTMMEMEKKGLLKGAESVITGVKKPADKKGPRYYIDGYGDREFIRMNSNSYLGLSLQEEVMATEEAAVRRYGTGPGAVRFISGTFSPHIELENRLADFHGRESALIFSSAYSAVMGVLYPLITDETMVITDRLNHNSIINAITLAKPQKKEIYSHCDMYDLEKRIKENTGSAKRVLIITDGIFSMRGDHAPLDKISAIADAYDRQFDEGIITVADDSHGVGAFGTTGRGTEEYTGGRCDILLATLGKALGVNGGYAVSSRKVISYLRETSPFYIYTNPITPAEAAAAIKALDILTSSQGMDLLKHLRKLTSLLESGLRDAGYKTIPGDHPIVPLIIGDTEETSRLVDFLKNNGVLATGIKYPVVPKGGEEIRLQVSADHTEYDIEYVISVLREFK